MGHYHRTLLQKSFKGGSTTQCRCLVAMTQIVPLKCPNCNANISFETTRCEYCGAFVCFQDKLPTLRDKEKCSACGTTVGEGSMVCANCGRILAKNQDEIESLKQIQKRLIFLQQKIREQFSNTLKEKISEDEYILFYEHPGLTERVVTDKRYFCYTPSGVNPESLENIPYEQIVAIGPIQQLPYYLNELAMSRIGTVLHQVSLTTFEKTESVLVSDVVGFYKAINDAFEGFIHKRRNIRAIICSLKFQMTKPEIYRQTRRE